MARNFIVVSGGPGIYVSCDPEAHDTGWSNYVDNILLLAAASNFPKQSDEDVWWFVYKPAYEARWTDDVANKRSSVTAIKGKGSTSYVNHLERRAAKYSWNIRWLTKGSDFWSKLSTFRDPISRVWYFGHARDDLWLSLNHDGCTAVSPGADAKITRSQMTSRTSLKSKFQAGGSTYDKNRASQFYGCNTDEFAKKFAVTFGVFAEGAKGKTDFSNAHSTGGKLSSLTSGCTWNKYNPSGTKI